ncbi:Ig-like domain repeat protein [Aquihabitans daechungensis]|uniref:Ig-like domain repeat protein n=1 Tax=Aquihabitans daechungensis TaxID=1052257 RepID=UPI003BA0DEF1
MNPGNTFAGYYPLQTPGLAIPPTAIGDDQVLNITVQPFRWNGATYTSLGVSANGYLVVGGADTAKDATAAPQNVPDASRPNNVLAPFWTDLTPAGGGALRLATVANTDQAPCDRQYYIVAQWEMFEFGTTTMRKAQAWIRADDPDCATDTAPAETIYFTYDLTSMTAAAARPFRVAAENAAGTVGGMRPAGELPTSNFVVTSSGTPTPAPTVTWKVTGEGRAAGTGTIAATVESTLIPGSSTVFTDVTVSSEALPVITDQPDDQTVTAKQQAVFTAAATGAASVRWQVSTDDGGSWSDIPGATATTYAPVVHDTDDGSQYRAVFANGSGGETETDAATLTVQLIATVTSVAANPAAPAVGDAVSLTATVAPADATGTVQFTIDGAAFGAPVPVSGGTATSSSTSSLAVGDHPITATFSGADHAGSVGSGTVSVGKTATTIDVDVDPVAPVVGDDVTFTASVAPAAATGTVQFTVDGTPLGSPVALTGGEATSPALADLARGGHLVEAAYSGDGTHAAATTGLVPFEVTRTSTTTSMAVEPAAPKRGEDVSFTATIAPNPGGGTVQFRVDGSPVGTPVAVDDTGVATSAPIDAPDAGDHTVSASFSGSDTHAPSTSATTSFTVAKRTSSTTVVDVRPEVLAAGEDVTVDVAVSPVPAGGTVQLALDGTDVGGPITLDSEGEATATLPDVQAGDPTVTASFSGDDDLLPSSDDESLVVYEPREAFVRRAYLAVLGRPGDDGGVAHHLGLLDAGLTPEDVGRRMADSAEGRRRLVETSYQRVLGRPVDPDGRAFWVARLGSGTSAEDLLATLIASPEAYRRGGGDPNGVVATLFRVHLGRAPDGGGRSYWGARIARDNTPGGRRQTALAFGRGSEATKVAIAVATLRSCGAAPPLEGPLGERWVASGRNPLRLAASALAIACPPEGMAP